MSYFANNSAKFSETFVCLMSSGSSWREYRSSSTYDELLELSELLWGHFNQKRQYLAMIKCQTAETRKVP